MKDSIPKICPMVRVIGFAYDFMGDVLAWPH